MVNEQITMKENFRFILLLLLFFGSAFANSKEQKFKLKLDYQDRLVMIGVATSSTQTSHSDALSGCNNHSSELDCFTQSCIACSGNDFAIYEVVSSISINFFQNNPDFIMPELFSNLLGSGTNSLHHRFNTHYTLRGQTTTTVRNLVGLLCCICCFPCCLGYELYTAGMSHQNEFTRIRELEAAVPNHLPEHVTISKRSLSHKVKNNNNQEISSSNTEAIDSNIHIFNIFLNTPETQQWIIEHLNPTTNQWLELLIPELFNISSSANVLVQKQLSENNSESVQPSHFITFNINNGITVLYHLNQLPTNNIQVLAIMISYLGYTLTLSIDDYDVTTNQPPPHYAEVTATCNCGGACNCDNFKKDDNNTDDSDERYRPIGSHEFFPHVSYNE